jgi:hypothetical protein
MRAARVEAPEPPLDSLDSLPPDPLRCDRCGWAVPGALDLTDDHAGLRSPSL